MVTGPVGRTQNLLLKRILGDLKTVVHLHRCLATVIPTYILIIVLPVYYRHRKRAINAKDLENRAHKTTENLLDCLQASYWMSQQSRYIG